MRLLYEAAERSDRRARAATLLDMRRALYAEARDLVTIVRKLDPDS